jgi:hypothetical protein
VGKPVGVEYVAHAHLACRDDEAIGRSGGAQLVDPCLELQCVAAKSDGLADKGTLQLEIGVHLADLVGLGTGKPPAPSVFDRPKP